MRVGFLHVCKRKGTDAMEHSHHQSHGIHSTVAHFVWIMKLLNIFIIQHRSLVKYNSTLILIWNEMKGTVSRTTINASLINRNKFFDMVCYDLSIICFTKSPKSPQFKKLIHFVKRYLPLTLNASSILLKL